MEGSHGKVAERESVIGGTDVTDEEIAIKLTVLEQETKSAKHRLDDLEVQNQAIRNLALSVKELTINMTRMMEEQEKQGQDIDTLKAEPAKHWKDSTKALFNAALGAIGTALGGGVIYLIWESIPK